MITVKDSRPASRVAHVSSKFSEDVALFLLQNERFTVTREAPMGAYWASAVFGPLVADGYMRKTQTGAYVWERHVAMVSTAGPSEVYWGVFDVTRDHPEHVAGGTVRMAADHDQAGLNEADGQARMAARAAVAELRK